ncbi:Leucine-rich repeat-containing protein [Cynara cardunculus var. scolymus]|uniref:Leucine-rich repeat-containing protein n=1 Tax=Cynara cardunculus var. scolymus TaxID=59895 RepID=A0A103XHH7_CYNCS|nr:Leucine-rich repeat-containing protein [Cynara cardunculus var. scolymus]
MHPHSSYVNSSSSSSIQFLDLSDNNLNSSMYRWLFLLTSNRLLSLHLSGNMLDGIPKYLGNLCSLTSLYFYRNSAVVNFTDFLNNLSGCTSVTLRGLYAPSSQLTGSLPDEIQNFSSLQHLLLHNNTLNGTMSEKVWELPNLQSLKVSSNSLVITPNIGKSKVLYVDLSNNSLVVIPSKAHISKLYYVKYIDLSACNLGPLFPKWIQTHKNLTYLDISNNRILGTISVEFWKSWPSQLMHLDLSSNNFNGKISDLSSNFGPMAMIDLSSNNFSGPIPNVPSTLASLNLSENKFYGGISFLCQIVGGLLQYNIHSYGGNMSFIGTYVDNAMVEWQGNEQEFTNNLGLLTSIDLSSNNLTGKFPNELVDLHQLLVLNLSKNALFGEIPRKIGEMMKLITLDLSRNNFLGEIPSSMSNMTLLSYLDVSYNKLSGRIPSSTQLQSFEPSRYTGNVGLCGPPLAKSCRGDEVPHIVGERKSGEEGVDELQRWFYIGGCTGFATGFWMSWETCIFSLC